MAHRHYGLRTRKLTQARIGRVHAETWIASVFIGIIRAIGIVLGVGVYVVNKAVIAFVNTTTSAPTTTGQGGGAPASSGMAR